MPLSGWRPGTEAPSKRFFFDPGEDWLHPIFFLRCSSNLILEIFLFQDFETHILFFWGDFCGFTPSAAQRCWVAAP